MLGTTAYGQLATLLSEVYGAIDRVQAGAPAEEVGLRVASARGALDSLQVSIGADPEKGFNNLSRHLYFLNHYHAKGDPSGYASDILAMRAKDLPAIIKAVEESTGQALDSGLVRAIGPSWEAQHYAGAVRDAFIYLETVLREAGGVGHDSGFSGVQLATAVLGPKSASRIQLSPHAALGTLASGEAEGAYNLVKGAFQLYRNATAHRVTHYSAEQAENVVRLVNLCVELLQAAGGATDP